MDFTRTDARAWPPGGAAIEEILPHTTHMGIGAHQDDLEIMAFHGISECFDSKEKQFTGVTCTDGGGSARSGKFANFTDEEMRTVRILEQERAAEAGRYLAMLQLQHPSADIKNPGDRQLRKDLSTILRAAGPSVLYIHNPADKHETHIAVFVETIAAIRELPPNERPGKVLGCEVWRGLDWMLDDDKIALGIGGRATLAEELIQLFESQIAGGKRYDLASQGRRLSNSTYHQSHKVDTEEEILFAMDLTPLSRDDTVDILDYTCGLLRRFEDDVVEKLSRQLGRK